MQPIAKKDSLRNNIDLVFTLLLIALGVYIFSPGAMTGDSVDQWRQVLHPDQIGNWFPPSMVYVWIILDKIVPGPMGMLIFHYTLYFLSIFIYARVFFEKVHYRLLFILLVGLFPPLFFLTGVIWKDVSMLGSISLSVSLLLLYKNHKNGLLLIFSIVFFIYGVSVRHNAVVCAIPYALYISYLVVDNQHRYRRGITVGLGLFLAVFFATSSYLLGNSFYKKEHKMYYIENSFLIWDLWGMSIDLNQNIIPSYVFNESSQDLDVNTLKKYYQPHANSVIWKWQYLNPDRWKENFPDATFKKDFLDIVKEYPLSYLKVRSNVLLHMLGVGTPIFLPYYFSIQKFPEEHYLHIFSKDLYSHNPQTLAAAQKVAQFFYKHTPIYVVWIYIVLAVGQLVILVLPRFRDENALPSIFLVSVGLIYWLPYFFVSTSADFRYSNLTIFFSLVALPLTVMHVISRLPTTKMREVGK